MVQFPHNEIIAIYIIKLNKICRTSRTSNCLFFSVDFYKLIADARSSFHGVAMYRFFQPVINPPSRFLFTNNIGYKTSIGFFTNNPYSVSTHTRSQRMFNIKVLIKYYHSKSNIYENQL